MINPSPMKPPSPDNSSLSSPLPSLPRGGVTSVTKVSVTSGESPLIDIERLRQAQRAWAATPLRDRLQVVRRLRHFLGVQARSLAQTVKLPQRTELAVTLASEVMPLAEACRFLEKNAGRILQTQKHSPRGQALWLRSHRLEIHHEPLGIVLILGPANYPLLLAGVQLIQALVAGNAVMVKPGEGGQPCMKRLTELLHESGLPGDLLLVLDESVNSAQAALRLPPDKVFLTGSATTGRQVLGELAHTLTPAVMELSGCDAVIVREDADLDLVVRALTFGLTINGSATCIAPRRVFVHQSLADRLAQQLKAALQPFAAIPISKRAAGQVRELVTQAIAHGAVPLLWEPPPPAPVNDAENRLKPVLITHAQPTMRLLQADLFAPVLSLVSVRDDAHAIELVHQCPYALGATVFGTSAQTSVLAQRLNVGCVVINDMIAPTADPRLAFAGRRQSGFGTTRGEAGLLEMTQPKAIVITRGKFKPHLLPPKPDDADMLQLYLQMAHAQHWTDRFKALRQLMQLLLRRTNNQ